MDDTFFYRAGHQIMAAIDYVGNLVLFFVETCCSLTHPPWFFQETIAQMYHLGVKSYIMVVVVSFPVGMILADLHPVVVPSF